MNVFSYFVPAVLLGVGCFGTLGCKPATEPGDKDPASPPSARSAAAAPHDRRPLVPVPVEVRADGLGYLPGESGPFTGEAITPYPDQPWLVKEKEPWREGKRHGDKVMLFKNGSIKTLRRYDSGVPKYAAAWHKNGQKKFELGLNAMDKGEGPYQRWYEDGTLESTAGFDAEERWHGELKEWTPAGVLKTHHLFKHGVLVQIMFESPESKIAREATGLILTPDVPAGEQK